MSTARIFKPSKTAMQSGLARTKEWVLEYEPATARAIDPLMGWTSTADANSQVRLSFDTQEKAVAYAERNGIAYSILPTTPRNAVPKSYSDNFAYGRRRPWTH